MGIKLRCNLESGHVYVKWAGQPTRRQGVADPIVRSGHIEAGDRILEAAGLDLQIPIFEREFKELCAAIMALPCPAEFFVQSRMGNGRAATEPLGSETKQVTFHSAFLGICLTRQKDDALCVIKVEDETLARQR